MQYKIGGHVSTAGGMDRAFERIRAIGGNTLQIFSSSPLQWRDADLSPETISSWHRLRAQLDISPIYFHAVYLVNLGDPGITGEKSVRALINELQLAHTLGVVGSIVHTGSFKNHNKKGASLTLKEHEQFPLLLEHIRAVLAETPPDIFLILENSGTRKIGQTLEQLGEIVAAIQDPRLKICLDTCHLHAAGYDLRTPAGFETFENDVDRTVGWDRVELFHLNDSKDPYGSLRDRHENIGEGHVGIEVFETLLNHPKTRNLPFILETPGFDGNGPDKENIERLQKLIHPQ